MRKKTSKPLILIGMMGAGKSTIGKKLATRLNCRWVDSDHIIEEETEQTIIQIFTSLGEKAFRQKEAEIFSRLLANPEKYPIIALGGGAFLQKEIRYLCLKKAITIWLQASHKTLLQRIGTAKNRPLLANGTPDNILKELLKKRDPIYAKADIIIAENTSDHMTENIISCLQEQSLL